MDNQVNTSKRDISQDRIDTIIGTHAGSIFNHNRPSNGRVMHIDYLDKMLKDKDDKALEEANKNQAQSNVVNSEGAGFATPKN